MNSNLGVCLACVCVCVCVCVCMCVCHYCHKCRPGGDVTTATDKVLAPSPASFQAPRLTSSTSLPRMPPRRLATATGGQGGAALALEVQRMHSLLTCTFSHWATSCSIISRKRRAAGAAVAAVSCCCCCGIRWPATRAAHLAAARASSLRRSGCGEVRWCGWSCCRIPTCWPTTGD